MESALKKKQFLLQKVFKDEESRTLVQSSCLIESSCNNQKNPKEQVDLSNHSSWDIFHLAECGKLRTGRLKNKTLEKGRKGCFVAFWL